MPSLMKCTLPILQIPAACQQHALAAEQNGQYVLRPAAWWEGARKFPSSNRPEGLDRAEGTMPGAAKVILSFKDSLLREVSSDPRLDFFQA